MSVDVRYPIGKHQMVPFSKEEKEGKLIRSVDGKWLGYSKDGKEWKDNPLHAIFWKSDLDDINKIYSDGVDLSEATLINVKKTIQIEVYE